jgi:hypothetical protein
MSATTSSLNAMLGIALITGMAMLAGCSSPPAQSSISSEQTTTAPAPVDTSTTTYRRM